MSAVRFATMALLGAVAIACTAVADPRVPSAVMPLSADQARALGVRFAPLAGADNLEVGTHARVVFRPDGQYVVAAPYPGVVPKILVALGQTVKAGQPLAGFASPQLFEAHRGLAEATAQAQVARQSLTRDQALYDDGIIAASRWQATQAKAAEATAALRARRAEIASAGVAIGAGGALLIAPRAGLVAEVNAVPGTRVDAAAPLFRIVDPRALELELLLGREIPVPAVGERVAVAQRGATARIIGVAPVSDGTAGVRVRAALIARGDLRAGETVNVTLQLRASPANDGTGRIRIPATALLYWQGVPGVFVAADKGFRLVPVTVDSTDAATAVVRGALPADAQIAVSGIAALKGLLSGDQ